MKKKIVISEKVTAVMLAAAMAISMTACGSPAKDMQGAAETAADEETSTVETAADRETSAVETVSEIAGNTTESTENAATDAEILVAEDPDTEITASNENTDIKVTVEDQKEEKKNDAGEVLVTISVQKATIEDSGYDALQKVLDQQSADTYELAQEAWGDMQTFLEDSDWETTGSLFLEQWDVSESSLQVIWEAFHLCLHLQRLQHLEWHRGRVIWEQLLQAVQNILILQSINTLMELCIHAHLLVRKSEEESELHYVDGCLM